MPLSRILFPVDFSPNCEQAARFVRFFGDLYNAEVFVLHVMPPAEHFISMLEVPSGSSDSLRREWTDRHHTRLEKFLANQLPTAQRVLLEGEPGVEICQYAERINPGLIVMPSHGFSAMRRFVLGSVTARILHEVHCPVFTDLPGVEFHGVSNVLCAVDLGEDSEKPLRFAATLAHDAKAQLTAVHAIPAVTTPVTSALDGDIAERLTVEARERVHHLLATLGVKAQVCVQAGDPAEVIEHAARAHHADLLVIGRGAIAGGLGRLRAHSYSIINQSPCPVLSV